jgi:hypothetical protein
MEKGMKNLNQAYRSAQKKNGTYEDSHGDSGIGHSDLDEEDDRLPNIPEGFSQYPQEYSPQQRVPSIQSMLHQYPGPIQPMQH